MFKITPAQDLSVLAVNCNTGLSVEREVTVQAGGSSKVKFFMKWAGLDLLASGVAYVGSSALSSSNICMHRYMPKWLSDNSRNIHYLGNFGFTNHHLFNVCVLAPFTEELRYRAIIQELFLKQLFKEVLGTTSPTYVDLVDSKAAKCARVVISSLLFALPHYISPESATIFSPSEICFLSNKVLIVFGSGLTLGALQEMTGNVAYPTLAHMLHNFSVLAIREIGSRL